MGLPFACGEGVLIPRPETELLAEIALKTPAKTVLDLCCGSGCIGISLAKLGGFYATLVDLYDAPLSYTQKNAEVNENLAA